MTPTLQAERITKRYRNGKGIEDVSLSLEKGEIFGLAGPNGAGKTTFLKAITGLLRPDAGETVVCGHSLHRDYERAMQSMGCLIEAPSLYEPFTARRNLTFHARLHPGLQTDRIDTVLDQTGLSGAEREKVRHFSQGMKQRLGIALALLSDPDILILDEPTNGLDVEGIVEFKALMKSLAEQGRRTILIASHHMFELESLCDRIGVIDDGKLICTEHTTRIVQNNQTLEQWYVDQVRRRRREEKRP